MCWEGRREEGRREEGRREEERREGEGEEAYRRVGGRRRRCACT